MFVSLFSNLPVPPIIEPFSFQDGLSEGMRTRTVCGVSSGDPPLVVSWLKDGQPLTPALGVNVSALDPYSSLLSISSLAQRHSGDFTCVASNPAAEVRYTAKLQVKGNVSPPLLLSPSLSLTSPPRPHPHALEPARSLLWHSWECVDDGTPPTFDSQGTVAPSFVLAAPLPLPYVSSPVTHSCISIHHHSAWPLLFFSSSVVRVTVVRVSSSLNWGFLQPLIYI